ncbi:T9SS type A sorting domain-containing protein [candidate division KSB1 bacterium]|nr:T9SS type A sorting domain-containing protein [candidate division KSB1 bacterium]
MRFKVSKFIFLFSALLVVNAFTQTMPLVYDVENTGADCPKPPLLSLDQLPLIPALPDPFEFADGRGRMSNLSDWRYRRADIGAEIQYYEIGEKPVRPDTITAGYSGGTLTVNVTKNGQTLTLTSTITLPAGNGPFPAMIGIGFGGTGSLPASIFSSRNIAAIPFSHNQVSTYGNPQNSDPYYQLYPDFNIDNTGQYSAWAWGVSRLIDGLELVQDVLPIDLKHLAVTGCSYAGKLALFAGAFDERIALTISQESGGGGYTTWRYSEEINKIESVETLAKTDYNWFRNSMSQFSSAVSKLPEDHHELMAMVAPRALLVTGNPGWVWLADESGYVGSKAAKEVWNALGVPDRFGYSQIGGHNHCAVPNDQIPEIEAFVEKFLLGNDTVNTDISTSPYNTDLSPWITWTTPTLSNDTTFFTTLVYPANRQISLDTHITFKWNKANDAEMYLIQISTDPSFISIDKYDSTTTDTLKTITGLLENKKYYWRVQVKSPAGLGPWSNISSFITTMTLPAMPQIVSATPYQTGYVTLTWKKINDVDQYSIQVSKVETFTSIFKSVSVSASDTVKAISWFSEGQKYYWRIRAENIAGAGPWSNAGDFTLVYAPSNFALLESTSNEIILFWKDKSSIEDGYVIERMQSPQTTFTVIDTLLGSGTEYVDKNVEPGQSYTYRIKAYKGTVVSDYSNEASLTFIDVKEGEKNIPLEYSISQNYPNPFNPTTTVKISLPQSVVTTLTIYDLMGREVQTLINKKLEAGIHEINFDASNLTNGVYFYKIQAGNFTATNKLILLK